MTISFFFLVASDLIIRQINKYINKAKLTMAQSMHQKHQKV